MTGECPYPNCTLLVDTPHAHNVLHGQVPGPDWASEYQSVFPVIDLARDPDDFRVTRQSKVTIGGLLVPVWESDRELLGDLFGAYEAAFKHYRGQVTFKKTGPPFSALTGTMQALLHRAAKRTKAPPDSPPMLGGEYITLDPRDYTTYSAPDIGGLTVISIHTRPERCWFLGILKFESALGLSLGRMRVMRPTDKGMYPVTIRTNWRALTNKVKQEEVRSAYQRLIQGG